MGYYSADSNCAERIFGPSVNAIIVDFMINSHKEVDRKEIETHVKEHIKKVSATNPEIKKRIPTGRESTTFWTDFLESNGAIITTSKRPKKYILNPNYEDTSALVSLRNSFIHRRNSRDQVLSDVRPDLTQEYIHKSAFSASLAKELIPSLQPDGSIRISLGMRELQQRWRNTMRIEEGLYAPDEMLGRAVVDVDGSEIGTVVDLRKVKRTFKVAIVKLLPRVSARMGLPEKIRIPVDQFSKTTARLDEVILSSTLERIVKLPSYARSNRLESGNEDEDWDGESMELLQDGFGYEQWSATLEKVRDDSEKSYEKSKKLVEIYQMLTEYFIQATEEMDEVDATGD